MATKCPKCQFDNTADSKFCKECGTQLISSEGPQVSKTLTLETPAEGLTRGTLFARRYEIIEELGAGGMGAVYRVCDRKLEEEVALKFIRPDIAASRKTVERFKNEIKIARKITHPNVCRMHDLQEEERILYITMEYVRGEDLKSVIHRMGTLNIGKAVSIAHQMADGLAAAHKLGIVHRDLKPGNIMIDKDGNAKIMDFGIARTLAGAGTTAEGAIIGTPEYMSPEQVEGKPADAQSDIYSLGIILFEMIVGCPPFKGETPFSIANKHKTEPPPIPKKLVPHIPDGLNNLILRSLEKDKTKRYKTASEFIADLELVEQALPLADRVLARAKTKTRISREITVKFTPQKLIIPSVAAVTLIVIAIFGSKYIFREKVVYPSPVEDSFIIVSFENNTGDKSQDTLCNVFPDILRTKFEQTGVRYVATLERMMELLKQVGKPDVNFIDSELGFELARRDGIKALVAGSYSQSGTVFVTTLRVIDVETKASLATASASGTGLESILTSQVDDLCRQIFPKLSFSQAQMEKAKTPVIEYTTGSLEAYKNFVLAREARKKWDLLDAKKYDEKAIAADPEFAIAYVDLGEILQYTGESAKSIEYLNKADKLRKRIPEKERIKIDWTVAFYKDGDLGKTVKLLEGYLKEYPKDLDALLWLGTMYRCFLGRYAESTKLYEKASELDPSLGQEFEIVNNFVLAKDYRQARTYAEKTLATKSGEYNLVMGYMSFYAGKLDEALPHYNAAKKLDPLPGMSYVTSNLLHYVYALKEKWPEALGQLDDAIAEASTPEIKFQEYLLKAMHEVCLGMSDKALQDIQEAQRLLGTGRATAEEQFYQALIDWTRFWVSYELEDYAGCRAFLPVWPERSSQMFFSNTFFRLASLLAQGSLETNEKRIDLANQTMDKMETTVAGIGAFKMPFSSSTDEERARFVLTNFQAEVWIEKGSPENAVAALNGLFLPEPPDFQDTQFLLIYLAPFLKDTLARAYERLGDFDKAIAQYERLLRLDLEMGPRFPPYPKYHLHLAKLHERKGNILKATEEYRRFLDLWKDADPERAELEDAKKSLARLRGS